MGYEPWSGDTEILVIPRTDSMTILSIIEMADPHTTVNEKVTSILGVEKIPMENIMEVESNDPMPIMSI